MKPGGASIAHRLLLRVYPPDWRRRYAPEFLALLSDRRLTAADVVDVLRGALDARLHFRAGKPIALPALVDRPEPQPALAAATFGIVATGPPIGAISRRGFLRRMLGVGAVLLSLEFLGGSLAFLWPNIREGLGGQFRIGRMPDLLAEQPSFASGELYPFNPARAFLVNVPAAMALAEGRQVTITDPGAAGLLALWRKCPHLGCLVPEPCEDLRRIRCRCHGSTYNILGEKLKVGPAERGLDRFAVRVEDDGMIVIDTGQIVRGAPNLGPERLTFSDPHPWDATCS